MRCRDPLRRDPRCRHRHPTSPVDRRHARATQSSSRARWRRSLDRPKRLAPESSQHRRACPLDRHSPLGAHQTFSHRTCHRHRAKQAPHHSPLGAHQTFSHRTCHRHRAKQAPQASLRSSARASMIAEASPRQMSRSARPASLPAPSERPPRSRVRSEAPVTITERDTPTRLAAAWSAARSGSGRLLRCRLPGRPAQSVGFVPPADGWR